MNKQDNKNMFLNNFDFMVKSLYDNSCLGISPKFLIFQNAPKPIIDLCGISFLCANFETFTILSAIILIYVVSASFVPILRPLPFLAQLY